MMDPGTLSFWHLLTRLGEAQIVLPAALLAALVLRRQPDAWPLVRWWMLLLGAAVLLTTASKLAFIGWGLGWPDLDFTGISGHAMFASAVYPLLLGTVVASRAPPLGRRVAISVVIGPVLPAVVVLFVSLMPALAPASLSHPAVTRLALILSGNKLPYTRSDMLRKLHASHPLTGP